MSSPEVPAPAAFKLDPYRLIVLGAGFSVPAGLPLARELSREVLRRAYRNEDFFHLNRDVERYRRFERRRTGKRPLRTEVDIEKLMSFLDIEHFLSLQGKDTWSEEGNKGQLSARSLVAQILLERQLAMTAKEWAPYLRFAEALCPKDTVITFNYDTIVESACKQTGTPFRLCPHRYKQVDAWGGTLDTKAEEVVVYKVHGSVDWYDARRYLEQMDAYNADPTKKPRPYKNAEVFGHAKELGVERIVRDPYPEDSMLHTMFRVPDMRPLMGKEGVWPAPYLISPSASKVVYLKPFVEFWHGFVNAGWNQSQMAIIGFSFSSFDDYVLVPIVNAIDNFEEGKEKWAWFGRTRLKIVDFQPSAAKRRQFQKRVRCVDWDRASCFWEGFNESIVPRVLEPNTFDRERFERKMGRIPASAENA